MRQVSLLCRWLPVQRVCEVVAVTPASAYRSDRYILQTELPAPRLDGLDALLIDEKRLGCAGFVTRVLNARTGELLWLAEGRGKDALKDAFRQGWTYTDRKCADKRLTGWITMAAESGIAELKRFARGLVEAKEQILNFC